MPNIPAAGRHHGPNAFIGTTSFQGKRQVQGERFRPCTAVKPFESERTLPGAAMSSTGLKPSAREWHRRYIMVVMVVLALCLWTGGAWGTCTSVDQTHAQWSA